MFGTDAQKQQYLVPLARGEKIGAWGLTESSSGSDAAGMRTTATRSGSHWVLNGSKTFTTHGRVGRHPGRDGDHGSLGRQPRHLRVHHREGHARPDAGEEGRQARHARERDERGPVRPVRGAGRSQLLGREGHGFVDAMQVLDAGRIGIAALAVGLAQGAFEAALRYAQERRAFGKTISRFQAIQWKLADNATRIDAARLLTYRAAYLKDHQRRMTLESAMAKLYASEIAVQGRRRLRPDSRRLRLREGLSGREVLPRREADDHRRRHQRDSAAGDRAPAAGAMTAGLAERVMAGDPRAIARAISCVEDDGAEGADLVRALFSRTGRAYLVGVTGPPGAGKSTLVDRLITRFRRDGLTVGVLAVDPTSPFSGGAVLGDRLRMPSHAGDAGRVHPQHGDEGTSRRTVAGHRRRRAGARRRRHGPGHHRNGRRRSGRSGHRARRPMSRSSRWCRALATRCRRSRPASWKSPISSSSTRRTARAATGSSRPSRPACRSMRRGRTNGGRRSCRRSRRAAWVPTSSWRRLLGFVRRRAPAGAAGAAARRIPAARAPGRARDRVRRASRPGRRRARSHRRSDRGARARSVFGGRRAPETGRIEARRRFQARREVSGETRN